MSSVSSPPEYSTAILRLLRPSAFRNPQAGVCAPSSWDTPHQGPFEEGPVIGLNTDEVKLQESHYS